MGEKWGGLKTESRGDRGVKRAGVLFSIAQNMYSKFEGIIYRIDYTVWEQFE